MNNWKPIAGFIENTIRPLIEEMKWFLDELDRRGIHVTEANIRNITDHLASLYLRSTLIKCVQNITIAFIIGYFACKIYR